MVEALRPRTIAIEANPTIGSSTRQARIPSRSSGDKAEPGMLGSPSARLHVCTGHHDRIMHQPVEPALYCIIAAMELLIYSYSYACLSNNPSASRQFVGLFASRVAS